MNTIYKIGNNTNAQFHADDIEECTIIADLCMIKYFGNEKVYKYRKSNVIPFQFAKSYSAPFVCAQFIQDNHIIDNIRRIDEYHYKIGENVIQKCWRINDGSIYSDDKINVKTSCNDSQTKDVFKYLCDIAEYTELRTDDNQPLLPIQYRKITSISPNSPFSISLGDGINHQHPIASLPIFPFGCNKSQYQAVKNALTNTISIIQGPPGTGKTQTILNIIANLLLQGKSVQVVSNNNAAVENIFEKLASDSYQLGFLVAQLGSNDRQHYFFDSLQTETYPDLSSWKITGMGTVSHIDRLIREKTEKSLLLFEKQERLSILKEELRRLIIEQNHFEQYLSTLHLELCSSQYFEDMTSKTILHKIQNIERRIKLREKWKIIDDIYCFILRIFGQEERDNIILHSLKRLFYHKRKEELENEIDILSVYIDKNICTLHELEELSLRRLRGVLYHKYGTTRQRVIYTRDALQNNTRQFLQDYPVVLSTTFSALNNIPTSYRYDYVIMDEASQVDIATGALALYSANHAVIVGDNKQLHNVVNAGFGDITDAIFEQYNIPHCYRFHYNYIGNSILQSLSSLSESANIPSVLLKEHYRCHPLIIGFCNKRFYNNQLVIMSNYFDDVNTLNIIRTTKGNHARGHVNQRQIDSIISEILPKLPIKCENIGIISPYTDQIKALQIALENNDFNSIQASTIHKFQGREKDVMILSTVDNEIKKFVDDPLMLNVAISRAKKQLYILIPQTELPQGVIKDLVEYIEYNHGTIVESKIYSIFDILYSQYTEERLKWLKAKHPDSKGFPSELLFYDLLEEIITEHHLNTLKIYRNYPLRNIIKQTDILTDEERKYLYRPGTHVDFLLADTLTAKPIFAIEVDGSAFHTENSKQDKRDLIKNSIFMKFPEIIFHRFSTMGSGQKEIVLSLLMQKGYLTTKK